MPSSWADLLDLGRRPAVEDHLPDAIRQVQQLADGGAALEPGAAALDAAGAFVELVRLRQAGARARLLEQPRLDLGRPLAVRADQTHQPLRHHAVERRHELIRLDAHVQEASQHVHDVVGVDGREHQVTGQRRLDGDLRRLGVADLAHHDLVGVVAEDRSQAASKRQALLLVDRNLRDAAQLILDRVFDRDDLVFRRS